MNHKDKEFIMNVRKKINYIEHIRLEEEKSKHCKEIKIKKNIKVIINFSIVLCLMLIPVLITKSLDMIYVFIIGIYVLGFCCYYENYTREIAE